MSEINEFKITQIVDSGQMVQLSLIENVYTEPISQKQMILENLKRLDSEAKNQLMPIVKAILQGQPTMRMKSYRQTQVTITTPKSRYITMGKPQVGDILALDITRVQSGHDSGDLGQGR